MSPDVQWVRTFDHAGSAMALSTVAVVSAWLGMRKFVGHRRVIISSFIFAITRSVSQVYLMVHAYSGGDYGSTVITILNTISCFASIQFAVILIMESLHILQTLTHTEAVEMVRADNEKDQLQVQKIYQYLADENRNQSNAMIARFAARGARD